MTDLVARVVAAIQQVRASTPHTTTCPSRDWETALPGDPMWVRREPSAREKLELCTCDREQRVDARLAACVEAAMKAADQEGADAMNAAHLAHEYDGDSQEAGLAAFLATAAQKEMT